MHCRQLIFLPLLLLAFNYIAAVVASLDDPACKSAAAALTSLGIEPVTSTTAISSSSAGSLCGSRCCSARTEATLLDRSRRDLSRLLGNYMASVLAIDYRATGCLLRDLPAAAAAAATPQCLAEMTRSRYCRICGASGDATNITEAASAASAASALRLCLAPLEPLSAPWDRLAARGSAATGCGSGVGGSTVGLFSWNRLLADECHQRRRPDAECLKQPVGASSGGRGVASLGGGPPSSVMHPAVARLLDSLTWGAPATVAAGSARRRRLVTDRGSQASGHAPPPSPSSPPPQPRLPLQPAVRLGGGVAGGSGDSPPEDAENGTVPAARLPSTSGDSQPPPPSMRPPSPSMRPPHSQTKPRKPATDDSVGVGGAGGGGSGDSESPLPPQPPPDLYPPLPDPGSPPRPDIWLPKSAGEDGGVGGDPDGPGGAVGNRGEGSVHGPQMMMRGQRRECLYSDSARCGAAASAHVAGKGLVAVISLTTALCLTVDLMAFFFRH